MRKEKKFVVWLTGLSGSGKTTIAQAVREELAQHNIPAHHLDGDEVRQASHEKLGFSRDDRNKNIRLAIQLAERYQKQDTPVIASFISPYREHRAWARQALHNFIEVFIDAPLNICESRDPKGLYKKARAGAIQSFTGIDDPYETPLAPDIHLQTHLQSVPECANKIISHLKNRNLI